MRIWIALTGAHACIIVLLVCETSSCLNMQGVPVTSFQLNFVKFFIVTITHIFNVTVICIILIA